MNCYMYVLDGLADWEISFITAELNSGRYLDKSKGEIIFTKVGNTLDPIITMGGMSITPDKDIANVNFEEGDLLVLPGSDNWMDIKNQKVLNIAANLINKNVTIAAICGATAALAQQGLLNDRKHTSNDKSYLEMVCPDYAGSANYIDNPVVVDGNLITATGLAPLEFSYEVLKKINVMKKNTVEAWFQLYKTKEPKYYFDLMESMK